MDSDNLHKLSHVALIVTNNELIIVDLFTRAKLLSFGSDTRNSPATIVISNYRGKGCQGILNPPMFANVQNDRAMLNVWSWMRTKPISRFVLPEKLSSLAVSGSGEFFIGGGVSGKMYIWEAQSDLIQIIGAYSSPIRVIKFTSDDAYIVAGGEDGLVTSWALSICTDPNRNPNTIIPERVFSDHALEITDIRLSTSLYNRALLFTASLDSQCKIWNFLTGDLLTTISMPSPVTSLACDSLSSILVIGCEDGLIYWANLSSSHTTTPEVAPLPNPLTAHNLRGKISCLEFSPDCSIFASGSEDGKTIFWSTDTKKPIFDFVLDSGTIYSVLFILRPPTPACQWANSFAHNSLDWSPWNARKDVGAFQKVIETPDRLCTQAQIFVPSTYALSGDPFSRGGCSNWAMNTRLYPGPQERLADFRLYHEPQARNPAAPASAAPADKISNYSSAVSDFMKEIRGPDDK